MNSVGERLRNARALVELGWTQGASARNAAGQDLDGEILSEDEDTTAVRWCAGGALLYAMGTSYAKSASVFRVANGISSIPGWNDAPERTQAEVLAAFDRAIVLAEQEAGDHE